MALKSNGAVVTWGLDGQGHAGVPVAAPSAVAAIAAGLAHTEALKTNGSVVAWGWNVSGQTTVPVGLPPAIAIAGGSGHTVGLVRDPAPSLTILRQADQTVSLSWRGAGALEQTASLTAPNWQPAPNQANPQTLSTTGAMKFFRVKAD